MSTKVASDVACAAKCLTPRNCARPSIRSSVRRTRASANAWSPDCAAASSPSCSAGASAAATKRPRAFSAADVTYDTTSATLGAITATGDPKVFTAIHFHFVVTGKALKPEIVERAVALSHEKYCSATAMLAKTSAITTSFEVVEA